MEALEATLFIMKCVKDMDVIHGTNTRDGFAFISMPVAYSRIQSIISRGSQLFDCQLLYFKTKLIPFMDLLLQYISLMYIFYLGSAPAFQTN